MNRHQLSARPQSVRRKDIETDLAPSERMAASPYRPLGELIAVTD